MFQTPKTRVSCKDQLSQLILVANSTPIHLGEMAELLFRCIPWEARFAQSSADTVNWIRYLLRSYPLNWERNQAHPGVFVIVYVLVYLLVYVLFIFFSSFSFWLPWFLCLFYPVVNVTFLCFCMFMKGW